MNPALSIKMRHCKPLSGNKMKRGASQRWQRALRALRRQRNGASETPALYYITGNIHIHRCVRVCKYRVVRIYI